MTIAQPAEIIAALDRTSVHRATPVGAGDVVWRVWGQGPPLVLLHGGTGSWMHWVRNIEALARDFTLLVPDLPGSGESAIPRPPISADSIGATLAAGVAEIIGPQTSFSVAGFSMGGLIAGYLVRHAGARAQCLVLVGATGTGAPRGAMEPLKSWRRLASDDEKAAIHRHNLGILMIHDPGKIDALAVHMQQSNAERSRIRGKHVSHTGTLAEGLAGFGGRLAGIWGEFDATAVPYVAERGARLRQFQPQASFDIFAGAGHWVQYEAAERFNIRLRELAKTAM
ncbi:MAG TPA: alpha/beta fold hydrolase [Xanthobacteraceae bacterium]|jgi:pimeloyl-ACP methyl ester carboxylesterase